MQRCHKTNAVRLAAHVIQSTILQRVSVAARLGCGVAARPERHLALLERCPKTNAARPGASRRDTVSMMAGGGRSNTASGGAARLEDHRSVAAGGRDNDNLVLRSRTCSTTSTLSPGSSCCALADNDTSRGSHGRSPCRTTWTTTSFGRAGPRYRSSRPGPGPAHVLQRREPGGRTSRRPEGHGGRRRTRRGSRRASPKGERRRPPEARVPAPAPPDP